MDDAYYRGGIAFVWNRGKAASNLEKHGVSFEEASDAFFDPFLRILDASASEESRDAIIGMTSVGRLLYVVHIEVEEVGIRLISARRATKSERRRYEDG